MVSADRPKSSFVVSFCSTAGMSARQIFDGGLLAVWGEYLIRGFELLVLTLVWRALAAGGADLGDLPLPRLLTYSLMASCLCNQLDVWTPATSSLWEGSIVGRYTRPTPVIVSFVAETVGRAWLPGFVLYSLPLLALSSFVGISPAPASPLHGLLAFVSLSMSVTIGFALDFLFAAFAMFLKNGCWAAVHIRRAVFSLLSGAFIPFALMPGKVRAVFALLPFGSIANAPLSLYVGVGNVAETLAIQAFWAAVLWAVVLPVFRKSQERMISFGG